MRKTGLKYYYCDCSGRMDRLLRLKEVREIYGIHPATIKRWEKKGLIKVAKTPGGRRRVPESELRRVLGLTEDSHEYSVKDAEVSAVTDAY